MPQLLCYIQTTTVLIQIDDGPPRPPCAVNPLDRLAADLKSEMQFGRGQKPPWLTDESQDPEDN